MKIKRVAHYTSLSAATQIIAADGLHFHGSRYDCMNDPTDYRFARDFNTSKLKASLSKEEIKNTDIYYPYIVSFCKNADDFLMWRLYNAEVSLVLDTNKFPFDKWSYVNKERVPIHEKTFWGEVEYCNKETIGEVSAMIFNRLKSQTDNHLDDFNLEVNPLIKHEAYSHEHEYRIFKFGYYTGEMHYAKDKEENCVSYRCEIPKDAEIRDIKDGDIRFYKDFLLPKDALKKIIVHTFDEKKFKSIKKHLVLFLNNNGYFDVDISQTKSYPVKY